MPKKVLLVDSKRNISFKYVNELEDFTKLLNGEIDTICIKPVARSICIAISNDIDLFQPYKKMNEILDGESFIVYIADNQNGKGIEGAPILNMNEDEVGYFHKYKEKVLLWN